MPIYAYKCASCGYAKDVLQKISDARLTVCPQCGKPTFQKQVTAAGFQLKGSGWYVTDFRNGSGGASSGAHAGEDGKAHASSGSDSSASAQGGHAKAEPQSGGDNAPSKSESSGAGASSAAPAPSTPSAASSSSSGAASGH